MGLVQHVKSPLFGGFHNELLGKAAWNEWIVECYTVAAFFLLRSGFVQRAPLCGALNWSHMKTRQAMLFDLAITCAEQWCLQ